MLLYITSEANSDIFNCICKENNITINKLNKVFDLNTLFSNNNYEHYQILAVDLSIVSNTDYEILNFFLKFRQLYDAKIIIVAIGRKVGDLILSKLVSDGIFNFITSEDDFLQKEEIKACILGNNGYKDCVKFKIQEPTKEIEKPNKLDKIKDFFNKAKIEKQPKIKYEQEKTEPKLTIIEKEKIIERQKIVEKKVLVKPKINKLKIAVCGVCERMGATTQAFLIANYLIKYGFNACYIEFNKKDVVKNIKNFYDVLVDDKNRKISYKDLDIFANVTFEDLPKILTMNYEAFIFDYGEFLHTSEESFASADVRIVVSGAKFWEEKYIQDVFKICHIYNDINFIFNFVDEDEQDFILKNMEELKVYFSDYAPNIFKIYNEKIYNEIFKDYLIFKEIGG
nr:hypothetical protein [uncultured Tyzzerella sp.]